MKIKSMLIKKGTKLDKLRVKIFKLSNKYFEEEKKVNPNNNTVIWVRDLKSGNLFIFTRGDYSGKLIDFVNRL